MLTAQPSELNAEPPDDSKPDLLDKQTDGSYRLMNADQGLVEGIDYYATSDSSTGAVAGYVKDDYVEQGQDAFSEALQDFYKYVVLTGGGLTINAVSAETVYSAVTTDTSNTSGRTTSFAYQDNSVPITQITETLPSIPTSGTGQQNLLTASGYTGTIVTAFYDDGQVHTVADADGYGTTYTYNGLCGEVYQTVTDVTLGGTSTIETDVLYDLLGRPVVTYDGNDDVTNIQPYMDGLLQSTVITTPAAGPTQEVVTNSGDGTITSYATAPNGLKEAISETWLDFSGRAIETQTVAGSGSTQIYTTFIAYDGWGHLNWTENAVGTFTSYDYDGLGRLTDVSITTADSFYDAETEALQYDNNGVGDGNLTQVTQFTNSYTPDHVTNSYYDWRDRLVVQSNGLQTTVNTLDNLSEVTKSDIYDAALANTNIVVSGGVPQSPANTAALKAQTSTDFDNRGEVYATHVYSVNQSSGAVGSSLRTDYFHDGRGNVVATIVPGGLVTTSSIDGAGRVTLQQTGNAGSTKGTIGSVVQSVATQYDGDSNPIFTTTSQLNTDGSTYFVTYVGNWYDAGNRLTDTVNYGLDGYLAMSARPDAPSGTGPGGVSAERTDNEYDAGGFLNETSDPLSTTTIYSNDYLGRVNLEQVYGYGDSDSSQLTSYSYDGLKHQVLVRVRNVTPGGTFPTNTNWSITQYFYQATTDNGSYIDSNDLLSEIEFPGGTTQQFGYDSLGQLTSQINRDTSIHAYDYDKAGRQKFDFVARFAPGVDQTVVALGSRYDALGRLVYATSYGSEGNAINEVGRVYDGLGNLVTEYQSHSGHVTGSTPAVQYQYTTTYESSTWGSNGSSLETGVTYPDGTVQINYGFGSSGTLDNSISRVDSTSIYGETGAEETVQYLGLSTVVDALLPQPNIDGSIALDNFGNVSHTWWTLVGSSNLVSIGYGYDNVNDMLWRQLASGLDQHYTYDALHRLTGYDQGTLDSSHTIPSPTTVSWTLDSEGNRYGTAYGTSYNA